MAKEKRNLMLEDVLEKSKHEKNKCTNCNDCCIDEKDYLITPIDILNIKNYFNLDAEYLINTYFNIDVGHFSKVPILTLKTLKEDESCIFNRMSLCLLDEQNPKICNLKSFDVKFSKSKNVLYINKDSNCLTKNKNIFLKNWLSKFDNIDELEKIWNEIYLSLFLFHKKLLSKINDIDELNIYYNLIFYKIYIEENGKTNLEIMKNRKKELESLMNYLKEEFKI